MLWTMWALSFILIARKFPAISELMTAVSFEILNSAAFKQKSLRGWFYDKN